MVEERRARANVLYKVKLMNELSYKCLELADQNSYLFANNVLTGYANLMSEIVDMINNMDDMLK